ncbi:MAG TPA: alpha/beta fold hydrolase [Opitutus sp.]|nr:alpha/beta fold hydrolase [Opitutus sp.]
MALFDLPPEQLRMYRGRNPRPADFDAYWAGALRELQDIDPRPELRPAGFSSAGATCFDLWFTSVGGARIYAKYLRPMSAGPHPAVLQFHGYSMNSGEWFDKLGWPAGGVACVAMDVRGQGGRSEDTVPVRGTTLRGHVIRGLDDPDPAKLAYRQIFLDTVQLARVVMGRPEIDPTRVSVWGQSQGGALALACAALEPRIRRCAAVHPFLCDYRRVWELDLAKDTYFELGYFFRMFDPQHRREEEIFTKLGYIDCQHLAPRIVAEVRMFTGLMDTVCPPSTQFAAFNKIPGRKDVVLYPDFAHEALPGCIDEVYRFLTA